MSLVTIILTTLNCEAFLARSIESCVSQTHRELELLIVDGGSTDGTLKIVASEVDPRVRLIHQPGNEGRLPGAINLGMAMAAGEYLTWTQADSWYEPDAIRVMVQYLEEHPQVSLVYTDFWQVDEHERPIGYQRVGAADRVFVEDVVQQCFLFRRQVYETIGPQDPGYFPVHEVPWRIKVAERFTMEPLHVPLLHYTVHASSLTGRIGNRKLRRMMAAVLFDSGYLDWFQYRRRLAEIEITEAWERYKLQGDYGGLYRHALLGIAKDPTWLRDRGLLKVLLVSLPPSRDRYRAALLAREGQTTSGAEDEPE